MRVSLSDVKTVFNDMIKGEITREQAEEWAALRMAAEDSPVDELMFAPRSQEDLL